MPHTLHDPPHGVATATPVVPPVAVTASVPTVPPADMTTVSVPMPTNVAELRQSDVGELVAVPRAPASGNIDVAPGTPVALVAQDFLKNRTVRVALAIIGAAFSLFIGYCADQILQTRRLFGSFPWYIDVLIIVGVGAIPPLLYFFWSEPIIVKLRKAIIAGFTAFIGYVGWTIVNNNGWDGLNWKNTLHAGLNVAIVAAVGGILLISKVFDNNPITGLPWKTK